METPIVIIQEEERLAYKLGSSVIYYRRVSPARARTYREMNTQNGSINQESLSKDVLEYCITGWDNIQDSKGEKVQFTPDKIDLLPGRIRMELIERITDGNRFEELLKN